MAAFDHINQVGQHKPDQIKHKVNPVSWSNISQLNANHSQSRL